MFGKNIKRVSNPKDFYFVVQAYAKWDAHLDNLIYQRILGVNTEHFNGKTESYESRILREKMWTLLGAKNDIWMMNTRDGRNLHATQGAGPQGYSKYVYSDANKSSWEGVYNAFAAKRDNLYQKYTRLVRDAFNALDEWLKTQGDVLPTHRNEEQFQYQGVPVRFMYSDGSEAKDRERLQVYLKGLHTFLERAKHLGMGRLLQHGIIFELDLAVNAWEGGNYDHAGTIRSTLWGYQDARVIAHEFGHHYYRVAMSAKQKESWVHFVKNDRVSFSDADYAVLEKAYYKTIEKIKQSDDSRVNGWHVYEGVWENMLQELQPGLLRDMYAAYLKQRAVKMNVMKKDVHAGFEEFKRREYPWFVFHAPTDYSSKNDEETFCEVFSYFVMGMGLSPIMEHQFTAITGLRR